MMKDPLRRSLKQWCQNHMADFNTQHAQSLAQSVWDMLRKKYPQPCCIGCYHPLKDEIDIRPLIKILREHDYAVALPAVIEPKRPLEFRICSEDEPLERDAMGLLVPNLLAQMIVPDAIIVPMLGFNTQHYRLGRGGGYYDRTLEKWPDIISIGVAATGQQTEFIPEPHDQPLGYIVTEEGLLD